MSLINEALKKAQKVRTGDPTEQAPMPGGGARIAKRGEARSTQQLVMIAAGALVLIVLSVVVTFWFINRAPAPKPEPKLVATTKSGDPSASSPTIVAPAIKPPVAAETPPTEKPATTPPRDPAEKPTTTVATTPPPTSTSTPAPSPAPTPPGSSTAPVATDTPASPAAEPVQAVAANVPTDPRVHVFIDTIKVMGIRSSGGDSRVLMNDRVFRVNDIVDRTLGVRLTKVASDALTFTDSNGAVYVKNF